jgi:hypothetical protein
MSQLSVLIVIMMFLDDNTMEEQVIWYPMMNWVDESYVKLQIDHIS